MNKSSRMLKRLLQLGVLIVQVVLLAGCLPPRKMMELRTQIAGEVIGTLTAGAPITTPTPHSTPTQSVTPTMSESPTPLPPATVLFGNLNLRAGPSTAYDPLNSLPSETKLKILGQYDNCEWIKVETIDGQTGWVKGSVGYIDLPLECRFIPHGTFRPANGSLLLDRRDRKGNGSLYLSNSTFEDSLVVLCDEVDQPLAAVYIYMKASHTLDKIADGSYRLYFMTGKDWDGDEGAFMETNHRRVMSNLLAFNSTGATATRWVITMMVNGTGTNSTLPVEPDDFPTPP